MYISSTVWIWKTTHCIIIKVHTSHSTFPSPVFKLIFTLIDLDIFTQSHSSCVQHTLFSTKSKVVKAVFRCRGHYSDDLILTVTSLLHLYTRIIAGWWKIRCFCYLSIEINTNNWIWKWNQNLNLKYRVTIEAWRNLSSGPLCSLRSRVSNKGDGGKWIQFWWRQIYRHIRYIERVSSLPKSIFWSGTRK